ncbi:class I SAM-dependent methyltransferase [Kineococcus sp. NPDC059986]|uniref:class I SAM-dependent methyltransferase n=1 Tax=Kineococcus sp. NPDC059986 TaxID=3155538 RepID=UPI00344E1317
MPDPLFADPRLAVVYDAFEDPHRPDLDPYAARALRPGVRRVLDVGCGTGVLAARLAAAGLDVVGADPAAASLAVARARSTDVTWLHVAASDLPALDVDLAVMTGNVAQVFLSDDDLRAALAGVARAVRPGGRFVLEARRPAARAWESWLPVEEHRDVPGVGRVDRAFALLDVDPPFVTFRQTYCVTGEVVDSDSTLRFWELEEVEDALTGAGFSVESVGQAPDRPGLEHVVDAVR